MFRRHFLKTSGLLSLSPLVPRFVNSLAATTRPGTDRPILVVVEMNGGNDGLNTVVPFADPDYGKYRKILALEAKDLHTINDSLGLHPSMRRAKELFDNGELAIVNGVGYPNPTRSHFESLGTWHSGLVRSRRENDSGWLGQALDLARKPDQTTMDGYHVGRESVPAALISRRAQVAALSRFADLQLDRSIRPLESHGDASDISSFVRRQVASAYATARQIESVAKPGSTGGYPADPLGQQMRLISQLIQSGSAARVYYTVQGGYDTHANQLYSHGGLLSSLSGSISALIEDLKQHGLDDRVVVLAFSEFGRRVEENNSRGTDHGSAGPVFLAGTRLKPGLFGETTRLDDLVDGDLKTQFDFRRVYATLLDDWLGISSEQVLQAKFEHLELF